MAPLAVRLSKMGIKVSGCDSSEHFATEEVLKDIIPAETPKQITVEEIQLVVSQHFGLRPADLKGKKRTRVIAHPRQVAMYLSRQLTDYSLPRLGEAFGGRDHTTVLHACDKIEKEMAKDRELAMVIEQLTEKLRKG